MTDRKVRKLRRLFNEGWTTAHDKERSGWASYCHEDNLTQSVHEEMRQNRPSKFYIAPKFKKCLGEKRLECDDVC